MYVYVYVCVYTVYCRYTVRKDEFILFPKHFDGEILMYVHTLYLYCF